jgi:hypothetical protein
MTLPENLAVGDPMLPKLVLRLPRLAGEFVATFAEKRGGYIWEAAGSTGWHWVSERIADAERDTVVEQLQDARRRFRIVAKTDADMLASVLGSDHPISDDDHAELTWAHHRLGLCLSAERDLTENIEQMTMEAASA